MKTLRTFCVAAGLCMLLSGCLSMRRTWEQASPFYVGRWHYSDIVYSGMDEQGLWDGLKRSINVGLNEWPIDKMNEKGGRLDTKWVRLGGERRRLELRIDRAKDREGNPGYLVSLRVLLQTTREVYSPTRSEYTWRPYGQDEDVEKLIFARIRDGFREYMKKEGPDA